MSFIHYLLVGHFERDGNRVRLSKNTSDAVYRPVTRRPIDSEVMTTVLSEIRGTDDGSHVIPYDWMIWLKDGYLACEKYTRNREAIAFVTRLVERTHCDIYDVSAHADIALQDWLVATRPYA
jgi:hypothetical protein